MKKGNSKNRHFSKGVNSHKKLTNRKGSKHRTVKNPEVQLAEKNFNWSRISTVFQLADFLIDKEPRLCKWLIYLLGMG
jgi:hypothetical protein